VVLGYDDQAAMLLKCQAVGRPRPALRPFVICSSGRDGLWQLSVSERTPRFWCSGEVHVERHDHAGRFSDRSKHCVEDATSEIMPICNQPLKSA